MHLIAKYVTQNSGRLHIKSQNYIFYVNVENEYMGVFKRNLRHHTLLQNESKILKASLHLHELVMQD